jgi:general secretion pathway protein G
MIRLKGKRGVRMRVREHVESMWTIWSRKRRQRGPLVSRLTPHAGGSAGFTFIEIMVVVAILAILAALVVPRIMGRTDDAKRTAAKVQIRNIEGALQLYKLDNGVYPTTEQGLKALVEKPSVGVIPKKWKIGGYIPKLPADPWANPYKYLSPSQSPGQNPNLKAEYEIISLGTDGEVGGEGINADITNWNLDKD